MYNSESQPDFLTFRGSMKAGSFTAQLGVRLEATSEAITIRASSRSYELQRENFVGLEETALFGIFKRGVKFRHRQQNLADDLVFYPAGDRDGFIEKLRQLGWS